MPVNTKIPLKTANRARYAITQVTDRAKLDLEDAISCALAAADSDRHEMLTGLGETYLKNLVHKVTMALKLARLSATSVPDSSDGQEEGPQATGVHR